MSYDHEMIRELRAYYEQEGIASDDFRCAHLSECSEVAGEDFTTAREPGIGSEYFGRMLPRICVVSLDPGKERDPQPVQIMETPASVEKWHEGRHWYQTHDIVSEILGVFDSELTPATAAAYFAHANAVRCCENHSDRSTARQVLYDNCQQYLRRELEILAPDIVISQGDKTKRSMQASFDEDETIEASENGIQYWRLPIGPTGEALWFHMYHPRYAGGYWTQKREELPVFQNVVRREFGDFAQES